MGTVWFSTDTQTLTYHTSEKKASEAPVGYWY